MFPIRFDTRFFLAVADDTVTGTVDGDELVDLAWIRPGDALDRERDGRWEVAFPTRETLRVLASASSAAELASRLRSVAAVPPVEPRLYVSDDEARILMPGDPGFDAAGPAQEDPTILDRLAAVVAKGARVPAEFRSRS